MAIKDLIQTNNEITINKEFEDITDYLKECIKERESQGNERYRKEEDKKLLKKCEEHIKKFETRIKTNKIIILTHPLYLHLSHFNFLKNETTKKEANDYTQKLIKLLSERDKEKTGLIILETLHHYAATTSLLLEQGLIDKAIITEYDAGTPLNEYLLEEFFDKTIYIGGGYNEKCLKASMRSILRMKMPNEHEVYAVKDLIIDSPFEYPQSIKPRRIDGIHQTQVITLDEMIKLINK
ncbi:MAG TPA: hypothetical protein VI790_03875 [Candidatus Nanoarchaeia archaeon]|nr:hypothetical protein [Candidatus Nanoarchaeia archaeon]